MITSAIPESNLVIPSRTSNNLGINKFTTVKNVTTLEYKNRLRHFSVVLWRAIYAISNPMVWTAVFNKKNMFVDIIFR